MMSKEENKSLNTDLSSNEDDEGDNENNDDDYIVKFKTNRASIFKDITSFFHSCLTILVFRVTKKGIFLRNNNNKETLLCDLSLRKEKFTTFIIPEALYNNGEQDDDPELILAVEAAVLLTITNSILKKDKIKLYVTKSNPDFLNISIYDKTKGRLVNGEVRLLEVDSLEKIYLQPKQPCEFITTDPIAIGNAGEFQKACKSGKQLKSKVIYVVAQKRGIKISGGGGTIVSKGFTFGKWFNDGKKGSDLVFDQQFETKLFEGISKCCPMSKDVRFYCEHKKALLVSLDAGDLGVLDIYVVPIK